MKHLRFYENTTSIKSITNVIEEYNNFINDIKPFIENSLGNRNQYDYFKIEKINKYGDKFEFTITTFKDYESLSVSYINISNKQLKDIIEKINISRDTNKYNI
jgi:hypothetical protein